MEQGEFCGLCELLELQASSIGNGDCDSDNNNEACGFDGGDCCERNCVANLKKDYSCENFTCMDPTSGCADQSIGGNTSCTGDSSDVGNGYCDPENNNEACGWDGGDCCECTCKGNGKEGECGNEFFCKEPDSGCTDPLVDEYSSCTGDLWYFGKGICDSVNNNEVYGWDGGDCCECTCEGDLCAFVLEKSYECLDPEAGSEMYGCLELSPVSGSCGVEQKKKWKVDTTSEARALTEALNCSGGVFEVTWNGTVVVEKPILVAGGTVLNVTGVGSRAVVDGRGVTGLFRIFDAFLYASNLDFVNGNSTSGGAIAALGSNVPLSRTSFVGNIATSYGGAVFLA